MASEIAEELERGGFMGWFVANASSGLWVERTPEQEIARVATEFAWPRIRELVEAIRLTQEYAQLPAIPGWSWYDALAKHAPEVLATLIPKEEEKHDP